MTQSSNEALAGAPTADEASVDEQFAELLLERSLSAIRAEPGLGDRSDELIQDAVLQQIPLAIAMQIRLDSGRIFVNASLYDATARELLMALEATGPVELGMSSKLRFIADQFAAEAVARGIEYPESAPDPAGDPAGHPAGDPAGESEDASSSPSASAAPPTTVPAPGANGDTPAEVTPNDTFTAGPGTAPESAFDVAADTNADTVPEVTIEAPIAPGRDGPISLDVEPASPALPAAMPVVATTTDDVLDVADADRDAQDATSPPEANVTIVTYPVSTPTRGVATPTPPATAPAVGTPGSVARESIRVRTATVDVVPTASIPLGRYADLVRYELGAEARAALTFGERSRLRAGISVGWGYVFDDTPYIDRMTCVSAMLEAGLRTMPGNGPIVIAPVVAGGVVVHHVSGEFNTLADTSEATYVDQLYSFRLEVSFEPWLIRPSRIGAFVAPTVNIFPNQTTGGMSVGVNAGIRLNPGALTSRGATP